MVCCARGSASTKDCFEVSKGHHCRVPTPSKDPKTIVHKAPTAKLRLAAIRHLFDWLVKGQVVPVNPAASVRGPTHVVRKGQTPLLEPKEARKLLDSINTSTPIGLRDR
jgi:site-specific recombinase XerC